MLCKICGKQCVLEEHYCNVPDKLTEEYDASSLQLCDVDIFLCKSCGHMQIMPKVNKNYYKEYSMGYFWGSNFVEIRKAQIERLAKLAPACNRFLDIGCGTGQYLALAQSHFEKLYGVEPSKTGVAIARQHGFEITNDFFDNKMDFAFGFDAISIIEVLEHLEDPFSVFSHAIQCLNKNGVILVEVPNGQRILEERLYYNICTDHIQYFTVPSLARMANRAGATVICVQESPNPNLLELYAKKSKPLFDSFNSKRQNNVKQIMQQIPKGARVAAWGAGAEASCFLSMLNEKVVIRCLFDSDESKYGHYIAQVPIVKPSSKSVRAFDVIILFANAHKQQIQKQLFDLGYTGKFLTFS